MKALAIVALLAAPAAADRHAGGVVGGSLNGWDAVPAYYGGVEASEVRGISSIVSLELALRAQDVSYPAAAVDALHGPLVDLFAGIRLEAAARTERIRPFVSAGCGPSYSTFSRFDASCRFGIGSDVDRMRVALSSTLTSLPLAAELALSVLWRID